jgi:hypothetical protein
MHIAEQQMLLPASARNAEVKGVDGNHPETPNGNDRSREASAE